MFWPDSDPTFKIRPDPDLVLKIWSDPDPVFKMRLDPVSIFKTWSDQDPSKLELGILYQLFLHSCRKEKVKRGNFIRSKLCRIRIWIGFLRKQ